MARVEVSLPWRSLEVKGSGAVEARWSPWEANAVLRELYLSWVIPQGEVRIGRQIFSWGAVDVNNPTDNLSSYDYYFLFQPGIERKVGADAVSVTGNLGLWQAEGAILQAAPPNRMVYDEPDFPLSIPTDPFDPRAFLEEAAETMEGGVRVRRSMEAGDISLSYFRGRDRMYSPIGYDWMIPGGVRPRFGYRRTVAWGADGVFFIGEVSIRGEAAFFKTKGDPPAPGIFSPVPLEPEATYWQAVAQAEFDGPLGADLMVQYIASRTVSTSGETFDPLAGPVPLTAENFQPGLGTPFANFAEKSLFGTTGGSWWDETLKATASGLVDLEEEGRAIIGKVEYSPLQNLWGEIGATLFFGGESDTSPFKKMERFSHISLALRYTF